MNGIGKFSGRLKGKRQMAMRQTWRARKFREQGGLCAYCKRPMLLEVGSKFDGHKLCTLDHRIPLSRGGMDHWENSAAACRKCNGTKGSMTEVEFVSSLVST